MEEGGFVVFYLQLLLFDMNVYVSLAPLKCNCFSLNGHSIVRSGVGALRIDIVVS